MQSKTIIIDQLQAALKQWQELITKNTNDSIKDPIAHLMAWQRIGVARLEAALHHREPVFVDWHPTIAPDPESKTELNEINAWIFDHYHNLSWNEVHQQWQSTFQQFINLALQIPESDLLDKTKYPWLNGYSLYDVLAGSLEHHQEHYHEWQNKII